MNDSVFVIRTTKYMERDLIAQTFSGVFGKQSFLVRGGQRSKKRFGGGLLETGNLISVEFKASRVEGKLSTLNEAKMLKGYDQIRLCYDKLQLVFKLFKIISSIEWTDHEYSKIFSLLDNTLQTIEKSNCLDVIRFIFLIKVLYLQGVLPINKTTQVWLRLNIKESVLVDKNENYTHYCKICDHLLKELTNKTI